MKKVKIIANPISGRETALLKVTHLVKLLSKDETEILLNFTHEEGDARRFAQKEDNEDLVVCCGGDGTVNEVVNGLYRSERKKPMAILQCGTVNDFANSLKLPADVKEFYKMIKKMNTKDIDIGLAGDRCFINVAAGGFLTDIAYTTREENKAVLGSIAYYIEGAKEILRGKVFKSESLIDVNIKSDERSGDEKISMFIIANSPSVGGFKNMAPEAEVTDGYLDVILIKALEVIDLPELVSSLFNGNHLDHKKVIYLKTKDIEINCKEDVAVDLDGEKAGNLPMRFKVQECALTIVLK